MSAFAHYHGTTRGTASQTIRTLVQKGFLRRLPDRHDQRSFRLDLTAQARAMLASDPFAGFASAAGSLGPRQCAMLARGLRALLEQVQDKRARRCFGVCTSCQHLQAAAGEDGARVHRCLVKDELLHEGELGRICIDYGPRIDH